MAPPSCSVRRSRAVAVGRAGASVLLLGCLALAGSAAAAAAPTEGRAATTEADAAPPAAEDAETGLGADESPEPPPAPIDVEVRGQRPSPVRSLRDPTVASYVLREQELRVPGRSAAEALAHVPGVQASRHGGSADMATASVRGATSAQTPISLAGIRLNDDLTGTVDLSTVPLWMLDRVEIYRGNAPLDGDRMGIGGAIRFEPRLPRERELGLGVGVGSYGARDARLTYGTGGDDARALLALRLDRADHDFGYLHDGGTALDPSDDRTIRRTNADTTGMDLWAVSRLRTRTAVGGPASLTVLLNGYAREAGAPGLQVLPAEAARAEVQRLLGGVTGRLPCSAPGALGGVGRCQLELSTSGMLTAYRLRDPDRELGQATELRDRGQRLTQRARVRLPVAEWLDLHAGTTAELGRLQSEVMKRRALEADRYVGRLELAAVGMPQGPLTIAATGAVECHATDASGAASGAAPGCDTLEPVGRLGARWTVFEPLALTANLGRYVRVPTLGELYGTSSVVRGNPDLAAEQGLTVDVGATAEGHAGIVGGYAQLVGFARHAGDLIAYRRSSFSVIRPYNVGAARLLGVETAAGGDLAGIVHAGAALTALDPRDVSDDRQVERDLLPYRARLTVAPHLRLRAPTSLRPAGVDRVELTLRYLYRSSRVADPAGLIILGEQSELDLELAAALYDGTLRLRAWLQNLLDRRQSDLLGYPLPGRSAYASMEAWW